MFGSLALARSRAVSLFLSRWISQEVLENKSFVVTEMEFNRDFFSGFGFIIHDDTALWRVRRGGGHY